MIWVLLLSLLLCEGPAVKFDPPAVKVSAPILAPILTPIDFDLSAPSKHPVRTSVLFPLSPEGSVDASDHNHRCPYCNRVWGSVGHSHVCPSCGKELPKETNRRTGERYWPIYDGKIVRPVKTSYIKPAAAQICPT